MSDSHKRYDRFNVDREKLAGLTAGCLIMACTVLVLGIWLEIER